MNYEERLHSGDVEIREEGDATKIAGYAVVFNELSVPLGAFRERFEPGAFKRVLNRSDDVQAWFNHDASQLLGSVASGTLRLEEDRIGLRYEIDVDPSDPDHQRVLAKVRRGDLRGSSLGFQARSGDKWGVDEDGTPLRSVFDVSALRDVGPASRPAYPSTQSTGALALRSLADAVDRPVDELVDAASRDKLADFLISLREGGPDTEASDAASTDAVSDVRYVTPLGGQYRPEWSDYR